MELLTLTTSSLLVSLLTEISKKWKVDPRIVVLILSLLLGAIWYVLQAYVPELFRVEVEDFIAGTAAGAVAIYEFFTKHINPK